MTQKNIWIKTNLNLQELESFCEGYKAFLSACKTERECVAFMEQGLQAAGALRLSDAISSGQQLEPGCIVYTDIMKKALLVFRMGSRPLTEGMRILGAHIDSPRLDLKQKPLYEDTDLALLDTHYYGGIKKYQ